MAPATTTTPAPGSSFNIDGQQKLQADPEAHLKVSSSLSSSRNRKWLGQLVNTKEKFTSCAMPMSMSAKLILAPTENGPFEKS